MRMATNTRFLDRLASGPPIVLDGATGTELERRGVDISLPLWSARALLDAPDVLHAIHADYVAAGAEIITAATFRTNPRSLAGTGLIARAESLTRQAVEIARSAAGSALVAGSIAPLEDCYSPDLTPHDTALTREHALMAGFLAAAGVDLILVETQITIREAVAATRAATATGLPVVVSFGCNREGRLLSGESLSDAACAVAALSPAAIAANCLPAATVATVLAELASAAPDLPRGAYANVGRLGSEGKWQPTDASDPITYSRYARQWIEAGARLVGGCCGTTPEHVRQLLALR